MKNIIFFISSIFFLVNSSTSQDLTGKWVASEKENDGFYGEMYLTLYEGKYIGYTYDEESDGFCEFLLVGKFSRGHLVAKNTKKIKKSKNHASGKYRLNYGRRGNSEFLRGTINTSSQQIRMLEGPRGRDMFDEFFRQQNQGKELIYRKVSNSIEGIPSPASKYFDFLKEDEIVESKRNHPKEKKPEKEIIVVSPDPTPLPFPKKNQEEPEVIVNTEETSPVEEIDSVAIKNAEILSKREKRTTKTVDRIKVDRSTIKIHIYDSKQEDNDRITIFLNDNVLVQDMEVKNKYHEIILDLPTNKKVNKLTFYANNLGTKPPNTANLRVIIGAERKHYVMSTNLLENSAIYFDMEEISND